MSSNIVELRKGTRRRVLIAHQRSDVRHALRNLIESEDVAVVEALDGEAALGRLEFTRFDLLVLELDLPIKDGLTVMQLHRMLLAHEHTLVEAPLVILSLAPEVRGNVTLTDHLSTLGISAFIDDAPRPEVANLVRELLQAHSAEIDRDKPAVA